MKKVYWFFFAVVFCLITGCSTSDEQTESSESEEQEQTESSEGEEEEQTPEDQQNTDTLVIDPFFSTQAMNLTNDERLNISCVNDFTFRLFKSILNEANNESVIISPLSVSYILGMLNNGATGQTAQEIASLLHFEQGDLESANKLFQKLIYELPATDSNVKLQLANLLAVDKRVTLESAFQQNMEDYYKAKVALLDFTQNTAVDYINQWCNEQTEGMIPRVMEYGNINSEMKISLVNAIYFNAPWHYAFKKGETKEKTFMTDDGCQNQLPMMHQIDILKYLYTETYSAIKIDYSEGGKWSMYLMLPHEGKTLSNIIHDLNGHTWAANMEKMVYAKVDVELPRFEITHSYILNNSLTTLGAPSLFMARNEFPYICQNEKDIFVSMIKHVASIQVSEQGTKVSAVTHEMGNFSSDDDDGKGGSYVEPFHANRPFVYLIQEASSGAIAFIGTYLGK